MEAELSQFRGGDTCQFVSALVSPSLLNFPQPNGCFILSLWPMLPRPSWLLACGVMYVGFPTPLMSKLRCYAPGSAPHKEMRSQITRSDDIPYALKDKIKKKRFRKGDSTPAMHSEHGPTKIKRTPRYSKYTSVFAARRRKKQSTTET